MKTFRLIVLTAGLVGLGSLASATPACTAGVSDVTSPSGFSCTLGPLTFSNFTVTPGSGFTAATVGINGGGTNFTNGDANIEFQVGGITATNPNSGDILLTYVVTGGLVGLDLDLQATPGPSGGSMSIFELACTAPLIGGSCSASNGGTTLANFSVTSTGNDATNSELFGSSWSGPVYIKKDIQFNGASTSEFNNSQIVPEPMTFSLLGLGLLGIGLAGRRLRK